MTRRSLEQKTECPGVRGQDVGVRGVSTEGSLNSASGTDGPITGISVFRCGRIPRLRSCKSSHLTLRMGTWAQSLILRTLQRGRITHATPTGDPRRPQPQRPASNTWDPQHNLLSGRRQRCRSRLLPTASAH